MSGYGGPPVCERCGKRHPLPWIHQGEQRCEGCKEIKPKSSFKRHHVFCLDCAAKLEAVS